MSIPNIKLVKVCPVFGDHKVTLALQASSQCLCDIRIEHN